MPASAAASLTRPGAGGFTLVEVMIASALLAVVVVALLQAVVVGQVQAAEAMHGSRATMLAETLMEEVLARPAADPEGDAPPGGSDRRLFDSIDDFDSFTQASGDLTDLAGSLLPDGYQDFGWSVTVAPQTQVVAGLPSRDGLAVTVTVSDATGRQWTVDRWVPASHGEAQP